jgi:hypothetical protein
LEGSSALVVVAMDPSKNVTAVFTEKDYMGMELGATWVHRVTTIIQHSDDFVEEYTGEIVMRVVAVEKVGDQSFFTIEETHQGEWDDGTKVDASYEYLFTKDANDRYFYEGEEVSLLEAPLEIGSTVMGLSVVRQEKRMTPLGELDAWVAEERYELDEGDWWEFRVEVVPYLGPIYQGDRNVASFRAELQPCLQSLASVQWE